MSYSEVSHVWIQKILPREILIMFAMVGDYKDYFWKFCYFNLKISILHVPHPLDPRIFKICP